MYCLHQPCYNRCYRRYEIHEIHEVDTHRIILHTSSRFPQHLKIFQPANLPNLKLRCFLQASSGPSSPRKGGEGAKKRRPTLPQATTQPVKGWVGPGPRSLVEFLEGKFWTVTVGEKFWRLDLGW